MEVRLNIYNKSAVEKTYEADTAHITFGTIEDLFENVKLDGAKSDAELMKMIASSLPKLKPFLKEFFVGITDDEIKRTRITELVRVFIDITTSVISDIVGDKNAEKIKNLLGVTK
jgi:hypothetical protein